MKDDGDDRSFIQNSFAGGQNSLRMPQPDWPVLIQGLREFDRRSRYLQTVVDVDIRITGSSIKLLGAA